VWNFLSSEFGKQSIRISADTRAILIQDFRGFPETLQVNAWIVPRLYATAYSFRIPPNSSFVHSSIILTFNAIRVFSTVGVVESPTEEDEKVARTSRPTSHSDAQQRSDAFRKVDTYRHIETRKKKRKIAWHLSSTIFHYSSFSILREREREHAVAQLVEALCYKPVGRGIESRLGAFFQLT
jgi:hypothetical protein